MRSFGLRDEYLVGCERPGGRLMAMQTVGPPPILSCSNPFLTTSLVYLTRTVVMFRLRIMMPILVCWSFGKASNERKKANTHTTDHHNT